MGWRGTQPEDKGGNAMRAHFDEKHHRLAIDLDEKSKRDIIAYIVSLNKPEN